jgi:hypothetical protein
MLPDVTAGAVMFAEVSRDALFEAFEDVIVALGYTYGEHPDFEVPTYEAGGGACFAFGGEAGFARALAQRVAKRLGREVRVFTAAFVERGQEFECALGDLRVGHDGTVQNGRWADDLAAQCDGDWGSLCDGKPYFAVSACLDDAVATALQDGNKKGGSLFFRSPPSLGSARLDDLAKRARLAERVQITQMGGRDCIRITSEGSTQTSFLDATEAAALREIL